MRLHAADSREGLPSWRATSRAVERRLRSLEVYARLNNELADFAFSYDGRMSILWPHDGELPRTEVCIACSRQVKEHVVILLAVWATGRAAVCEIAPAKSLLSLEDNVDVKVGAVCLEGLFVLGDEGWLDIVDEEPIPIQLDSLQRSMEQVVRLDVAEYLLEGRVQALVASRVVEMSNYHDRRNFLQCL